MAIAATSLHALAHGFQIGDLYVKHIRILFHLLQEPKTELHISKASEILVPMRINSYL